MALLTKRKASILAKEDTIRGKKPTARQKRFFRAVAGGAKIRKRSLLT